MGIKLCWIQYRRSQVCDIPFVYLFASLFGHYAFNILLVSLNLSFINYESIHEISLRQYIWRIEYSKTADYFVCILGIFRQRVSVPLPYVGYDPITFGPAAPCCRIRAEPLSNCPPALCRALPTLCWSYVFRMQCLGEYIRIHTMCFLVEHLLFVYN